VKTTVGNIADLAVRNRPVQFTVLERAAGLFEACPAVTMQAVRGSLEAGTSDRLSDVDLVVGVHDADYPVLAAAHHDLIGAAFCQVLPGWADTIVPDFGGLGWVHLLQHDGAICQLDLYLIPESRVSQIPGRIRRQVIYSRPSAAPAPGAAEIAAHYVARARAAAPTVAELVIEALILASMIKKRIGRGQPFMAYKEKHQLVCAVQALIRTALLPETAYLGWYHLEEMIGKTPTGRECLAVLADMIAVPAVPAAGDLTRLVDLVLQAAALAAPAAVESLQPGIDTFQYLTGTARPGNVT
jgi:hypothetical protein